MNIVYATDHKFVKSGDTIHSLEFTDRFFQPYLDIFENITLLGRYKIAKDETKLPKISSTKISFVGIENLSTIQSFFGERAKTKEIIDKILKKNSLLIARLPSEIALLAIAEAKKNSIPYIVELAGCPLDMLKNYGSSIASLYAPILYKRVQKAVWEANGVIYVTEYFLQNRYPSPPNTPKISISNVNLKHFSYKLLSSRIESIIKHIQSGNVTIGTIANLDMRFKGLEYSISAFAKIYKRYSNSRYRIAGGGDFDRYKNMLLDLDVEDSIKYDGILYSDSQKYEWLDNIDIYIQPSLTEGLPRAVIEAMSRGCIVIASNVGGIPEILKSKSLFSPKNIEEIEKLIMEIISQDIDIVSIIESSYRKSQQFSNDKLYKKRIEFLKYYKTSYLLSK